MMMLTRARRGHWLLSVHLADITSSPYPRSRFLPPPSTHPCARPTLSPSLPASVHPAPRALAFSCSLPPFLSGNVNIALLLLTPNASPTPALLLPIPSFPISTFFTFSASPPPRPSKPSTMSRQPGPEPALMRSMNLASLPHLPISPHIPLPCPPVLRPYASPLPPNARCHHPFNNFGNLSKTGLFCMFEIYILERKNTVIQYNFLIY